MKNRAKCRKCGDIIESFHNDDFVSCKCSAIYVDGGTAMRCGVEKDWNDFVRIDDNGNEIIPKVIIKTKEVDEGNFEELENLTPLSTKELLDEFQRLIDKYDELPENALNQPVTHYELVNCLLLVSGLFRRLLKDAI